MKLAIDNREFEPLPKAGAGIPSESRCPPMWSRNWGTAATQPTEPVDPSTTADAPVVRETDRYIKIPDKYYLVETSGFRIRSNQGNNNTTSHWSDSHVSKSAIDAEAT